METLAIAEERLSVEIVHGETMMTLKVTMLLAVSCRGVAFALKFRVTIYPIKARLLETTPMINVPSETPKFVASVGSASE